jgi:hypothetical protein
VIVYAKYLESFGAKNTQKEKEREKERERESGGGRKRKKSTGNEKQLEWRMRRRRRVIADKKDFERNCAYDWDHPKLHGHSSRPVMS